MGTSNKYDGPSDKNWLLPDDFIDPNGEPNPEDDGPNDHQTGTPEYPKSRKPWQAAKNGMSKYVSGTSGNYRKVAQNYIAASGGAKQIASSSKAGKSSTLRLADVLTNISRQGINQTFRNLHISLEGKSAREILSELVNIISDEGDTKEEVVARNASVDAMIVLYEYIEENGMDIGSLDSIDDTLIDTVIGKYISAYIWGRLLNDLQSSFEKHCSDPQRGKEKENELKEYIQNTVEVRMRESEFSATDLNGGEALKVVDSLYEKCFNALEVLT